VPGYYYRLNGEGQVETSTCCQNTATEHTMMEKLMIDSALTWARAYKVDGFRFDLMGHHMLSNMVRLRAALDALTLEQDGVDGKSIYVYGEGWDFGEVAGNRRGVNATQLNIARTGIGVFNDRMRDGVRGGNPFDDPRLQGYVTGLYLEPNEAETRDAEAQRARLLEYSDWIRVGLAGNLRAYRLVNADGNTVSGEQIQYGGAPAGYTLDPQENVVYVSAHDNETLFDAIQFKAPASATLADRVRMNNLAVSLVMLSQGVPFFHAGDDLLRSKSLDRDSYNSGDWFNQLDFTYQTSNFGVGLPIEGSDRWPIMQPLLREAKMKPGPADILSAVSHFREMLQIRHSSPLFRLRTANDVSQHLTFLNTGPEQIPGLIVMNLTDSVGADLDPNYEHFVVLFNASRDAVMFKDASYQGRPFELHLVQQNSADAMVKSSTFDSASGTFTVPGRTTAVFVVRQTAPEPTRTPSATATAQPTLFVPTLTPEPPRTATPTSPPPTLTPSPQPPPPEDAPRTPLLLGIGGVAGVTLAVLLYRQWRAAKRLAT
jgi:pullulanase-type alpha-1,6-glucosidase